MTILEPKTLSDQLLYCTIQMVIETKTGSMIYGTGFMFSYGPEKESTFIITNKHVVDDGVKGIFTLHEGKFIDDKIVPTGMSITVELENLNEYCIYHPNIEIDLCAIPITPLDTLSDQLGKHYFSINLTPSMILSDEDLKKLGSVENVLMTGYPLGLWDYYNNFPLIRRGITSSHPAIDFQGRSISVIDIATFPGSSGSPVLIINDEMYRTGSDIVVGERAILLGILFAYPTFTLNGEVVVQAIPTAKKHLIQSEMPTHLGYIVKARELFKMGLN